MLGRTSIPAVHKSDAGWSSQVAREAHNLEVAGSNPVPANPGSSVKSLLLANPGKVRGFLCALLCWCESPRCPACADCAAFCLTIFWNGFAKEDPVRTHAWLEATRIAWSDRLRLFGDPRFVDVPCTRLMSEKYAQESAKKIQLAITQKRPVSVSTDGRTAGGTVHLSAVDGEGMMASVTLTHGDSFGARVAVDGLGLILGHGMSRFDPVPGKPNSIAPRKRPLDNMCPTIVLRDGKPILAVGAAGGRRIPNGVFEVLLNLIVDGCSLEEAVTQPRLHTEGGLAIHAERGRPKAEIQYLKRIGFSLYGGQQCYVAAVQTDPSKKNGAVLGVADMRPSKGPGTRDPHPLVTHAD